MYVIHFLLRIPGMIVSSLLEGGAFSREWPWRALGGGDNSRSGSVPRRRIQSGLPLLDTDCRIKDGGGRKATADCWELFHRLLSLFASSGALYVQLFHYRLSRPVFRDFTHSNDTRVTLGRFYSICATLKLYYIYSIIISSLTICWFCLCLEKQVWMLSWRFVFWKQKLPWNVPDIRCMQT